MKKKVLIINTYYNEVCDSLLLSEEQIRLLAYLVKEGYCNTDMEYHILEEEEYKFTEI